MTTQLRLIEPAAEPAADDPDRWRLDDTTRAIGRRGLARARAALRAAPPATTKDTDQPDAA